MKQENSSKNSGKIWSKIRGKIRGENSKNSGNFRSATFLTLKFIFSASPKSHPSKPHPCNMPQAKTEVALQFSECCAAEVALQHWLFCSAAFILTKSCAAASEKLQCNIEKAALQESGAFLPLSCGFQAPTFRHPRLGPVDFLGFLQNQTFCGASGALKLLPVCSFSLKTDRPLLPRSPPLFPPLPKGRRKSNGSWPGPSARMFKGRQSTQNGHCLEGSPALGVHLWKPFLGMLPCPSFPWCFCFLGVFLAGISLLFLNVFGLVSRIFKGSRGEENP